MNTERISSATGKFMIAIAAVIDGIQFLLVLIPFIGWFISSIMSIVAAFLFGIWFSHLHVGLMRPQRILGFGGAILGEILPFIGGGVPFWTSLVAYNVIREWRSPEEI